MLDFADVWAWTGTLKTSLAFTIALPIAVAALLATIVDWIETRLTNRQRGSKKLDAHIGWARWEDGSTTEPRLEKFAVARITARRGWPDGPLICSTSRSSSIFIAAPILMNLGEKRLRRQGAVQPAAVPGLTGTARTVAGRGTAGKRA